MMIMAEYAKRMVYMRMRTILVGNSVEKRPFGELRCRWEGNMKIYITDTVHGVEWIYLARNRLQWRAPVNILMNIWVI